MIYIDPSELRETSNLKKYIAELNYLPLPGLEARTGADIMVSPTGLPKPVNDKLLLYHVLQGAKLIQDKFNHDLTSSVVDGRLAEALSRMLKMQAQAWQALLLSIGHLGYDSTQGIATMDSQMPFMDAPLTWRAVQSALIFWVERGGSIDYPLPSGEQIAEHLSIHQNHIDRFRSGEDVRTLWPKKPAFYEEAIGNSNAISYWRAAQKLERVDDIRVLLCAIPDAHIGPERATAILDFMRKNGIREDFSGFMRLLEDKSILQVPGIGKKTLEAIQWGLWRTKEEREARQ